MEHVTKFSVMPPAATGPPSARRKLPPDPAFILSNNPGDEVTRINCICRAITEMGPPTLQPLWTTSVLARHTCRAYPPCIATI